MVSKETKVQTLIPTILFQPYVDHTMYISYVLLIYQWLKKLKKLKKYISMFQIAMDMLSGWWMEMHEQPLNRLLYGIGSGIVAMWPIS